jgi:hypothetical protein
MPSTDSLASGSIHDALPRSAESREGKRRGGMWGGTVSECPLDRCTPNGQEVMMYVLLNRGRALGVGRDSELSSNGYGEEI